MKKTVLSLAIIALCCVGASAQNKTTPPSTPTSSSPKIVKGKKPPTPPPAAVPPGIPIGSSIPNEDMPMTGVIDRPLSLMQAKTAKGLLVMFSCNTCPYVVKAQPRTIEAMKIAQDLGVGMVIINSNEAQRTGDDSPDAMRTYAQKQHYTVPYLRDDASMMANAFGATRTPEVYLFNGDGKLVYKGAIEDNPAEPAKSQHSYVSEAMKAMVVGQPVNPTETKSIGCSIKRM